MPKNLPETTHLTSPAPAAPNSAPPVSYTHLFQQRIIVTVVQPQNPAVDVPAERQKERTAYTILNEYVQRSGRQHRVYIVHRQMCIRDRPVLLSVVFIVPIMYKFEGTSNSAFVYGNITLIG